MPKNNWTYIFPTYNFIRKKFIRELEQENLKKKCLNQTIIYKTNSKMYGIFN